MTEKQASFIASNMWVGEQCYICKEFVKLGQRIMFLGGPDLAHLECLENELDR